MLVATALALVGAGADAMAQDADRDGIAMREKVYEKLSSAQEAAAKGSIWRV